MRLLTCCVRCTGGSLRSRCRAPCCSCRPRWCRCRLGRPVGAAHQTLPAGGIPGRQQQQGGTQRAVAGRRRGTPWRSGRGHAWGREALQQPGHRHRPEAHSSPARAPAQTQALPQLLAHLGLQLVREFIGGEPHIVLLQQQLQPRRVVALAAHHRLLGQQEGKGRAGWEQERRPCCCSCSRSGGRAGKQCSYRPLLAAEPRCCHSGARMAARPQSCGLRVHLRLAVVHHKRPQAWQLQQALHICRGRAGGSSAVAW